MAGDKVVPHEDHGHGHGHHHEPVPEPRWKTLLRKHVFLHVFFIAYFGLHDPPYRRGVCPGLTRLHPLSRFVKGSTFQVIMTLLTVYALIGDDLRPVQILELFFRSNAAHFTTTA